MSYFTPSGITVTSQTVAGVSKEMEKNVGEDTN